MIKINLLGDSLAQASGKKSDKAVEQQAEQIYAKGESSGRSSIPVAGLLVALFFALASTVYYLWLDRNVKHAEQEKVRLEAEKKELEKYTNLHKEYLAKKELLKKKITVLKGLKQNQELMVKVIEQLANMVPDDVWFNDVYINGRNITVGGFGRTFESVNQFRSRLSENKQWFTKVNHTGSQRDNQRNVQFTITFELVEQAS